MKMNAHHQGNQPSSGQSSSTTQSGSQQTSPAGCRNISLAKWIFYVGLFLLMLFFYGLLSHFPSGSMPGDLITGILVFLALFATNALIMDIHLTISNSTVGAIGTVLNPSTPPRVRPWFLLAIMSLLRVVFLFLMVFMVAVFMQLVML